MRTSKQVDWLSVTIPIACANDMTVPFLDWRYRGKGKHGYQAIYSCDSVGATLETLSANPDMGTHLTLPGRAMAHIRQAVGICDNDLIAWVDSVRGKPSRLDMCMDIRGGNETPQTVLRDLQNGAARTRAKSWQLAEGKNENTQIGDTLYIGRWDSDWFMRVYNKNAERNITDLSAWTRFEIVTKNLKAIAAKNAIASVGVMESTAAHLEKFLKWDSREYKEALGCTDYIVEQIEKKRLPKQQWLLGQVAKALAKEIAYNPEFETEFMDIVHELVESHQEL